MQLFELRGKLDARTRSMIEVIGAIVFLVVWWAVVQFHLVYSTILPSPLAVVSSIPELVNSPQLPLLPNLMYSVRINLLGYAEAVAIALPLGYLIGLLPLARGLCERLLSAIRYLPITALIGLFIMVFGIFTNMKVQFLTLGIVVYLLPAVVVRIDEVQQVYDDTAKTIGASPLQRIRFVYLPAVLSVLSDDILNLTALSWTYIIVVEGINRSDGGIGPMFYLAGREGRVDKVYALLVLILTVGFIQDKLWKLADRLIFRHKYA